MPRLLRSFAVLLLLLCVLVAFTSGDGKTSSRSGGRVKQSAAATAAAWRAEDDDFNLTPEQERLLFEEVPTTTTSTATPTVPLFAPAETQPLASARGGQHEVANKADNDTTSGGSSNLQPPASSAAAAASATTPPPLLSPSASLSRHSTASPATTTPNIAATASPTSPSSATAPPSLEPSSCEDDFGGVVRLLSALFSPTAIRRSGHWSIHTAITQSDYNTLTRLLRANKPQDALDLVQLGERFLRSAAYHATTGSYADSEEDANGSGTTDPPLSDAPLTAGLSWLQRWVRRLERVLHHRLVAPLHLPSSASLLLHGGVILLLPAALFVALKMAAPVVVNAISPAVSPRTRQRNLSHAQQLPSSAGLRGNIAASPSAPRPPAASSALITQHAEANAAAPSRRRGVAASRGAQLSASPESFASALWIGLLLLLLTLFTAGYVHHYHTLHIEQLARNRIIQSNPPPGCYQTNDSNSLTALLTSFTIYLTRSQRDDACWRYEASLLQSSWPNPLLVLSSYLSTVLLHPLTHAGEALGGFTRGFLSHHSVVMQGVMLAFLLLFSLGVVALCMVGGKACLMRWCCGWGGGSGRPKRSGLLRLREGRAVAVRRRQREEDARMDELLLEEDEEEDEEEEHEHADEMEDGEQEEEWRDSASERKRRLVRRLLREHTQRVEDDEQRRGRPQQQQQQPVMRLQALTKEERRRQDEQQDEKQQQREEEYERKEASRAGADVERKRANQQQHSPQKAGKQKAVKFHPQVGRVEEEDSTAVKHEQEQQHEQEHEEVQRAVKKEEQAEQKDGVGADSSSAPSAPSSSSSSSSASASSSSSQSSPTSNYPVCSARVKEENDEAMEWSVNPINLAPGSQQ